MRSPSASTTSTSWATSKTGAIRLPQVEKAALLDVSVASCIGPTVLHAGYQAAALGSLVAIPHE
jgi:hypothetical protein